MNKSEAEMAESNGLADESRNVIDEYLGLAFIFTQVVLIILVMRELDIVSSGFRRIVGVAAIGFVIHHFLPFRMRPLFFVLLSLGGMFLVLSAPSSWDRPLDLVVGFKRGGAILAIGLVLIGICHLPVGFWKRAGLLLGAASIMGMFRVGILKSGGLDIIWLVLAAIFMFRIIIYLYDISTSRNPPRLSHSLAYFFLFPNVCFTLFPVIDFKTFCSSYYNESPLITYRRGMTWMVRGVIQLLIYRFVYQLLYIKADYVDNGTAIIQYLVTNIFLYLKVSGQFHLIVGILLLFGFNLPETNHYYFLASSFTDYWRRVNIYWKDFMMKVFYYPAFFKLKKFGSTNALVISTLWVFLVTWALHMYQAWWLRGSATVTWPDVLFWTILGLLVLINSLWEMKRGRTRKLPAVRHTAAETVRLILRTTGTFTCITLLWSLWSAPSVSSWIHLWTYADMNTLLWSAAVLATVILAKFVLEILPSRRARAESVLSDKRRLGMPIRQDILQYTMPLILIFLVTNQSVQSHIDDSRLQPFQDVLVTGDSKIIGGGDGYYENLTGGVDEGERQLWGVLMRTEMPISKTRYHGAHPVRPLRNFRFREPIPSTNIMAYETRFKTNRWGMRDQEYDMAKPDGTVRIAVLGSSQTMGWGVRQQDTFEAVVERRLNEEFSLSSSPEVRFEVLNFAFNGLGPLGEIVVMDNVRAFNPDIVIYLAKLLDFKWVNRDLVRARRERITIPYKFLQDTLDNARVTAGTREDLARKRLRPYEPAIVKWSYQEIVEACRNINALPVSFFVVFPSDIHRFKGFEWGDIAMSDTLKAAAVEAGFTLIDLSNLFVGKDPKEYLTKGVLPHSNPKAHRIIADAIYKELTTNPRIDLINYARRASKRVAVVVKDK
jgi:D-alanyl-lipoteichoic acid acyltransferase DltB (MBOAT superfamily)